MTSVSQMLEQAVQSHRAGQLNQAELLYQQILKMDPGHVDALHLIGVVAHQVGRNDLAIDYIQQALRLKPDYPEAHNNLGLALQEQGKPGDAIPHYQQALRLKPDYALAHNNLGLALQAQGKVEEAILCYQQALRLKPDFAKAFNNLGNALRDQGRLEEAINHYRQALRLEPEYAEAYSNLGIVLRDQRNFDEAITHFQQALHLKPDYAQVHSNLGLTLQDQGELDEAIAHYHQALRLKPDYAEAHSNLVFSVHFHPNYDSAAILREARRWNDCHAEPFANSIQPHPNSPDSDRRLRIGYVSPDFCAHVLSCLTISLLANHDHRQVEVFCYADNGRSDDITQRYRDCADVWRSTVGITDEQVAEWIRSDRIDILVDLSMHMAKNRLRVFARKPAPIQATWCYPGTTGLATMDYRLTDPYLDPPGQDDSCYSEESYRLPNTFFCYSPHSEQPPVNELPALANGFVTFGCLNNFCKVNDSVLTLWAKVLAVSGNDKQSRLLLMAPRGQARDRVLAFLKQQGIDEPRVEFVDRQPLGQYLQLYNRIDLCLDLLPYNGHTTSLDAFWMGVPTVTQIGKTVVGRAGWSELCNLGLRELAAQTPEEFVKIAVQLAGDLPRLRELRATLRERMRASPLMDGRLFARHMEQAYRQMWRKWCQKEVRP